MAKKKKKSKKDSFNKAAGKNAFGKKTPAQAGRELLQAIKTDEKKALTLIKAGIGLEERGYDGRTPLMEAVIYHRPTCLQALVDAGAKLDEKNLKDRNMTALIYAAHRKDECAKILIKAGASLEEKTSSGQTALMAAASIDHPDLKLLITKGAKLD